jgi:hypothetical protein
MAFGIHTPDNCRVTGRLDIDLALVDVVSSNEKGGFAAVRLENVQDVSGVVGKWAIIISDSNGAGFDAVINASSSIRNRAENRASYSRGVGARRYGVIRATWTILIIASGRVTKVSISTAIAGTRAAISSSARSKTRTTSFLALTTLNIPPLFMWVLNLAGNCSSADSEALEDIPGF